MSFARAPRSDARSWRIASNALIGRRRPPRTLGVAIEFQEHEANRGGEFDPTRTGFDHMGWRVDSLDHLHQWQERLGALGVEHTPIVQHDYGDGPMHVLTFKDPDRIQFEFFYWAKHP